MARSLVRARLTARLNRVCKFFAAAQGEVGGDAATSRIMGENAPGRRDHTLLPSADLSPRTSGSSRVLAPEAERRRFDRAVSIRGSQWLTRITRPATPSRAGAAASIASRPAYRDDRETPLLAGRDG